MIATLQLPPLASVVEAALEGLVLANVVLIHEHLVPLWLPKSIRYKLEPEGQEDWKLFHNVLRDGWGDCEDIAAIYAASYRASGLDEGARVRVMVVAPGKLHAVTELSTGEIVDHCIDHGMPHFGGITEGVL
jgi:hypothetical protein